MEDQRGLHRPKKKEKSKTKEQIIILHHIKTYIIWNPFAYLG